MASEPSSIYGWNGERWTRQVEGAGYNDLHAVSCPSRTSCTAVGGYAASSDEVAAWAEQWNGARWSNDPTIYVPSSYDGADDWMTSVYCASRSACIALGATDGTQQSFVSTWDGTTWTSTAP